MSERHDQPGPDDEAATPEGEAGRDELAGARGGQPGYDLDEAAAYEDAGEGHDDR